MHTQLQANESILKVVWIVIHQNKLITRLHSYIIIFQTSTSEQCHDSQSGVPTVDVVCPRKLDIGEFLAKQEIINDIGRKNLLDNVFQPEEGFTFPTKQLHGCFGSFNYVLSGILIQLATKVWNPYFVCRAFYLQHHRHACLINYQALASDTKQEKKRRNIATLVLTNKVQSMSKL